MRSTFKRLMKHKPDIFNLLQVILMACMFTFIGCGDSCDENARKEAWKKYDTALLTAKNSRGKQSQTEFAAAYAKTVDDAIAQRQTDMATCHCPKDRPEMSDADIRISKANLRRLETKILIKVCTMYDLKHRAVDSTGAPKFRAVLYRNIYGKDSVAVLHPLYIVLSQEAFDSLRTTSNSYKALPASEVLQRYGPFALEEEYRQLYNYNGPQFLSDIEALHNTVSNWSRCGLSANGRNTVMDICKQHELDSADVIDALTTARVFCD